MMWAVAVAVRAVVRQELFFQMRGKTIRPLVGISCQPVLWPWIVSQTHDLNCIQVWADGFERTGQLRLDALAHFFPLMLHTCSLSLGSPFPLNEISLAQLADLTDATNPLWISDYLGFRFSHEIDLGQPLPITLTDQSRGFVGEKVETVMEACGKQLLLENIASPLLLKGSISEPTFLNRMCASTGCGVLLNLANLVANSRNHGFDPQEWIDQLDPRHVIQVNIGSCHVDSGYWIASCDGEIDNETWSLAENIVARARPKAAVLEYYGICSSQTSQKTMTQQVDRLKQMVLLPVALDSVH
jgi:uncharacterized protein